MCVWGGVLMISKFFLMYLFRHRSLQNSKYYIRTYIACYIYIYIYTGCLKIDATK